VERLAAGAPLAVRDTKPAVNKLVKDALNGAFDTSLALEIATFHSEDHREALAALREKRPRSFVDAEGASRQEIPDTRKKRSIIAFTCSGTSS
jgi:hypothetical protein